MKMGAILPVTVNAYPTTFLARALTNDIHISLTGYKEVQYHYTVNMRANNIIFPLLTLLMGPVKVVNLKLQIPRYAKNYTTLAPLQGLSCNKV